VRRLRAPAAALALAAALAACASAPDPPERTVLVGSSSEVAVLLPLNVTAVMPEPVEAAAPAVFEELRRYLRAHGTRLKTLAFPAARQLWLASIREARSAPGGARAGFDEAARIFAGKIAAHAEFDNVIVASLFLQGAPVSGLTAAWDGVERTVEIEEGRWADTVSEETLLVGLAPAVSLHAVVLDAEGAKVQEAQAGLALLSRVRVLRPEGSPLGSPRYEWVPLPEPFARRKDVRQGIARALAPFLPPLEPPAEAD